MGSEFPESGLVRKTFTIRQMHFPPEVSLTKRSLVRWFALSFGLISEKESRSTVLDVLDALFTLQLSKNTSPTTAELLVYLAASQKKIDEKLLRYHVKRLTDIGLVERRNGKLSFATAPEAEKTDIANGFRHAITSQVNDSAERIALVLGKIKGKYSK